MQFMRSEFMRHCIVLSTTPSCELELFIFSIYTHLQYITFADSRIRLSRMSMTPHKNSSSLQ